MAAQYDIASLLHQIANRANDYSWRRFWNCRIDGDLYSMGIDLNKVNEVATNLLADLRGWGAQLNTNYPLVNEIPTAIARIKRELARMAIPVVQEDRLGRVRVFCASDDAALSPDQADMAISIGQLSDEIVEVVTSVIEDLNSVKQFDLLPTINDTERERTAYENAIKAGYMRQEGGGYRWRQERGMKARLARFVIKLYRPKVDSIFPQTAIEKLFGVSRIDSACMALDNNKKPQKWYEEIDALVPKQ